MDRNICVKKRCVVALRHNRRFKTEAEQAQVDLALFALFIFIL